MVHLKGNTNKSFSSSETWDKLGASDWLGDRIILTLQKLKTVHYQVHSLTQMLLFNSKKDTKRLEGFYKTSLYVIL